MRKYSLALLAAAAIGLAASAASAADLPRKAPAYAPSPPPFSWTGFYIGIHGGAGWGTVESDISSITTVPPAGLVEIVGFPLSSHGVNGWLVGGTVGYNWQVNHWLVLGIEGDWTWTDIKGTAPCLGCSPAQPKSTGRPISPVALVSPSIARSFM